MTEFLIYQGKAAIALAVFYMFYRLLLSKETFHRFNRIVLLGTAALSFLLPLCVITIRKVVVVPAMTASSAPVIGEANGTVAMVSEVAEPLWPVILCILFASGAFAILVKAVVSIIGIKRIIRSGSSQILESGETLIITETDTAPFSWMKYIVISREDYESGYSQIVTHEKAHIALRHSWDILFVDMITALQWFNPAIWMLKADLRALHEFEADDAVLRSGANIKEYQYLLIRKAVSKSGYSVANSFNHSTLKARITMMLNKKSSRMSAWKALYVIPLVGISLAATAETKVDYQYETSDPLKARVVKVHDTPEGKDTKSFKDKNVSEGRIVVNENNLLTITCYDTQGIEHKTTWEGLELNENVYFVNGALVGKETFDAETEHEAAVVLTAYLENGTKARAVITPARRFISGFANMANKYYSNGEELIDKDNTELVMDEDEKGNVTVKENVNISGIKIRQRDENGNDVDADTDNILIIINGEKKPAGFDLNSINPADISSITVLKDEESIRKYGAEDKEGIILITTGSKATFSGDDVMVKFQEWVQQNVKYPENCDKEGRVDIMFTVSETGKVTDVKVARGIDPQLDAEAVRVISASPEWEPATADGKPTPTRYIIPVMFQK